MRNGRVWAVMVGLFLFSLVGSFLLERVIRDKSPNQLQVVTTDDPELDTAIQTAQTSLKTFEKKLSTPRDRRFAVKVRFTDALHQAEMMWVDHLSVKGTNWKGSLSDSPKLITNLKKGSEVAFPQDQIVDWIIVNKNGTHEGAYTDEVLEHEKAAG